MKQTINNLNGANISFGEIIHVYEYDYFSPKYTKLTLIEIVVPPKYSRRYSWFSFVNKITIKQIEK